MTNSVLMRQYQKYSIGIEAMDAQHAHWIHLIEEFRSIGSEQLLGPTGIRAAAQALEHLLRYTQTHFASEEQFMSAQGYPGIAAHKERHRELEAMVAKLLGEIQTHRTGGTPLKLNLFVTIWLLEHILQEDDRYARFVLGKPQSLA